MGIDVNQWRAKIGLWHAFTAGRPLVRRRRGKPSSGRKAGRNQDCKRAFKTRQRKRRNTLQQARALHQFLPFVALLTLLVAVGSRSNNLNNSAPCRLTSACFLPIRLASTLLLVGSEKCRLVDKRRNAGVGTPSLTGCSVVPILAILLIIAGDVELNPGPFKLEGSPTNLAFLCSLPLAADWKTLGTKLLVPQHQLDIIQSNHAQFPDHSQRCLTSVFEWWFNNCVEPTCELLIQAVNTMGRKDVAKQICENYGISSQLVSSAKVLPECITNYAAYLKEKYKELAVLPDSEWPPSVGEKFIRLALIKQDSLPDPQSVKEIEDDYIRGKVDKILNYKEEIELTEMFKLPPDQHVLKVLIDGAPGVGKTTLSRKICKDWANEELLHDHHLVVLLHLRERRVARVKSIQELFYCDDPILQQSVVQHIQSTSGENVLLIFDAFDELGYVERTQESLFLDIIKGKKLHKCTVIVTSRPYASETLHQLKSVNCHIEVLGFRQTEIHKCIMHSIPNEKEAKKLTDMLQERLDIVSLCYIPLNCAIMLYVYKESSFTLPNTLTELFKVFVLHSLKRHSKGMTNARCSRRAMMASDIDKMPETLKIDFKNLAKLAYNGLMHDNLVFSYDEIESIIPDDDDDDANIEQHLLGLMTATKSSSSTGGEVTYQFLHLTIQEFLAAKWATVEILPEQQAAFMKRHLSNDRLRMMLLFLAGITELRSGDLFSGETLSFPDAHERRYPDQHIQRRLLFLCHITYEAQSSSLCHSLTNSIKDKTISLSGAGLTLFDYRVLGYFLANSDCHFKSLKISGNISKQDLVALKQGALIQEDSGSAKIECVDFLEATNHYKLASTLLPTVPILKDCEVLLLYQDNENGPYAGKLHYDDDGTPNQLRKMQCLIRFSVLGKVAKQALTGISASSFPADEILTPLNEIPTLRILELEQLRVYISEDTCSRIKGMMSRLTALRVIQCEGFGALMNCVAQSLTCTTSLVELEMSDSCVFHTSDETYVNLFKAIKKNCTLKKLDVSKMGYYPRNYRARRLRRRPNNRDIEEIRQVQRRAIGIKVLEAVYEMLSCNNTLEELYLFGWNLIGPSLVPWSQRHKKSSSRQQEVNPEKLEPMAKGLVHNHALLKLGIEDCSIEPLKLQVTQLKQTSASKHPGPNPNLHYTAEY